MSGRSAAELVSGSLITEADTERTLEFVQHFAPDMDRETMRWLRFAFARHRLAATASPLTYCEGVESGPNGRGGMRVVAHFPTPGDEWPLCNLLSTSLPEGASS